MFQTILQPAFSNSCLGALWGESAFVERGKRDWKQGENNF
jgi:hypothetical protein